MPRQEKHNGPDWTDIHGMMSAIDALHGSSTWLDLQAIGTKKGTDTLVTVVSTFPSLQRNANTIRLVTQELYPSPDSDGILPFIFQLLYKHDARISKEVYAQQVLPSA